MNKNKVNHATPQPHTTKKKKGIPTMTLLHYQYHPVPQEAVSIPNEVCFKCFIRIFKLQFSNVTKIIT
jgi:hypothetical protein